MDEQDGGFAAEVERSFPPGLRLPEAIRRTLVWMEANGFVHAYTHGDGRYASLFPGAEEATAGSCLAITTVGPGHAQAWLGKGVPGAERLVPFLRTGGDGSYAALWLDPTDTPRFVHMGSGSGSTWAGMIADDAVDMLRFLAIGYGEACWPEDFDATPREIHQRDADQDEPGFVAPSRFQDWLSATFGVTIPARAREIVQHAPEMGDDEGDDAFLAWLRAMQAEADRVP